ncbi:MAG TPA: hypothetical protein VFU47_10720, partial [Armatimonadota bacterium]|nr:hypothetical protein [Armatimonadota bacterium]
MTRPSLRPAFLVCALLLCCLAAARADDWPQFRRDPNRTAASKDPLHFPLTEVWSRAPGTGHSPLYHVAAYKGRLYFLSMEGERRYTRHLYCVDARTGFVHWKRELETALLPSQVSHYVGPAVSESGVVFVYDQMRRVTLRIEEAESTRVYGEFNDLFPGVLGKPMTEDAYARLIEALRGWDPWAPQLFAFLADTGRIAHGIPVRLIPTLPPTVNLRLQREKLPIPLPPLHVSGAIIGGKAVERARNGNAGGITPIPQEIGSL